MKTIVPADVRPWTKVGEPETLAKLHGAYLMKQRFCSPDGTEDDFSLFGGKNWAIVCPITTQGNLILVRQYKQGIDGIVTEFPAGTASEGEGLEKAAGRELMEETGYVAEKILPLHKHAISTRKSANFFRVFVALGCSFTDQRCPDPGEIIEVLEATPGEFWDAVRAGEITEPSTLTAALYAVLGGHLGI